MGPSSVSHPGSAGNAALVVVAHDRQTADAVRRCMDWKYALSLDLHDSGFDFTLLHDFRCRLLTHEAGNGSSIPSWPPATRGGGSRRGVPNGPVPRTAWRRSARCTAWSVSWRRCIGP